MRGCLMERKGLFLFRLRHDAIETKQTNLIFADFPPLIIQNEIETQWALFIQWNIYDRRQWANDGRRRSIWWIIKLSDVHSLEWARAHTSLMTSNSIKLPSLCHLSSTDELTMIKSKQAIIFVVDSLFVVWFFFFFCRDSWQCEREMKKSHGKLDELYFNLTRSFRFGSDRIQCRRVYKLAENKRP